MLCLRYDLNAVRDAPSVQRALQYIKDTDPNTASSARILYAIIDAGTSGVTMEPHPEAWERICISTEGIDPGYGEKIFPLGEHFFFDSSGTPLDGVYANLDQGIMRRVFWNAPPKMPN